MNSAIEQFSAQAEAFNRVAPLELSVIIPTYRERDNIAPVLAALEHALLGTRWEVIFVDDHSPDYTADEVRAVAVFNPRVRILERVGRRGLIAWRILGVSLLVLAMEPLKTSKIAMGPGHADIMSSPEVMK